MYIPKHILNLLVWIPIKINGMEYRLGLREREINTVYPEIKSVFNSLL